MFRPYWKNPLHVIIFIFFVASISLVGVFIIAAMMGAIATGLNVDPEAPNPFYDACFTGAGISLLVWVFSIPVFVTDLIIYLVNKKRFNNKIPRVSPKWWNPRKR